VYWEGQPDRGSAQRRESALRRISRAAKLRLISELAQGEMPVPAY
jgi:predicted GIY-YIG superfamily endonuclease